MFLRISIKQDLFIRAIKNTKYYINRELSVLHTTKPYLIRDILKGRKEHFRITKKSQQKISKMIHLKAPQQGRSFKPLLNSDFNRKKCGATSHTSTSFLCFKLPSSSKIFVDQFLHQYLIQKYQQIYSWKPLIEAVLLSYYKNVFRFIGPLFFALQ